MEFKGTKGNLELFGEPILNEYNFYRQSISVSSSHNILFANVYGKNDEETKANALLISKSKEMLEMLKVIHQQVDFSFEAFGSGVGLIMESNIKQLIKEATEL
jgi:hypothetical protein